MTVLRGTIAICQDCAYQSPYKIGKKRIEYYCNQKDNICKEAVKDCDYKQQLDSIYNSMTDTEVSSKYFTKR
jgi:hypothetical protein